jgi:hypothetical protein
MKRIAVVPKRTQLYLSLEQFHALRRIAETEKDSIAAVVRNAISEYLAKRKVVVDKGWENDPINKAIGSFEAEEDLSVNHDRYLY